MATPQVVTAPKRDHLLSDKTYVVLSALAKLIFPALGTLYFALAGIWGLPYAEKVIGTIIALDTFLNVLVKVAEISYDSSSAKYDGVMDVLQAGDKTTYSLNLKGNPEVLGTQDKVTFKVNAPVRG